MSVIRIENLEQFSSSLTSISSEANTLVESIKTEISSISSDWQGSSFACFSKNMGEILFHLNNMDDKINEVAGAITSISNRYTSADTGNV